MTTPADDEREDPQPVRNDAPEKATPAPDGVLPETTDDDGTPLDNPSG